MTPTARRTKPPAEPRPPAPGSHPPSADARPLVRCAIYTRKSTEEGLEQEFNSLDAQRESGEAYIRSQAGEGWVCLPTRYDDGGYSGGTTERPALQRLLADLAAGKIDVLVVYKVDRLSRSLLDFSQLMKRFDEAKVAFVSVTQLFNTANSMGRLMLNVLLSFAQFEREIISERTRDKIAATRRKGKWSGGRPVLGFEVDAQSRKLVIVEPEAERVRAIYRLYLELGSLLPVVEELQKRAWRNKSGREFNRNTLYLLLTNVLYAGQVRYKQEVHPGEHPALIDQTLWEQVQTHLHRHGRDGTSRKPSGALLQGVLRCGPCQSSMTPTYSSKGGRKYHYYVCSSAQKLGRSSCPTKSVSAGTMDTLVVEQLQRLARAAPEGETTPPWQAVLREKFSNWSGLDSAQQSQVLRELLERIEYDGRTSQLAFQFREPEAAEPGEEGSC